jgi:hypothetical protein
MPLCVDLLGGGMTRKTVSLLLSFHLRAADVKLTDLRCIVHF